MNQLNRSLDCAKQLNKYLLNLDVIKEYQKYEQLIHQDDKIEKLEAKMKAYQKKIVNQKSNKMKQLLKQLKNIKKLKMNLRIIH